MNIVFDKHQDHEQVVFCQDPRSGLRAIIAIHSTALGPALGGTRFYPYESDEAALADVLRLSRGMSYKSAMAGLDLGGGKAVIIGDPAACRSEALLRAYGCFVESLGGRYITACDVGTYCADMDIVARESHHVTGRSAANGGAGDSAVLTAFGVLQGMKAAVEHRYGTSSLLSVRVGVEGVGKVGSRLVDHLIDEGASVTIYDVDENAVEAVLTRHPAVEVATDRESLMSVDSEVYAPCALGGVLTEETAAGLGARIVCGAANNQLAEGAVARALADRDVLYLPDYVVNAGGLIQVADEIGGFDFGRAQARVAQINATTHRVLDTAAELGVAPVEAADLLAQQRIAEIGALRSLHLPQPRPVPAA
jgi:valine dehydrogenase (NAD+)